MSLAGMMKAYILLVLRGYKALLSPMLPHACRFVPTCSEYAMEAIDRYGALQGGLKALGRLLRCHPFAAGGYDPVILPEQPAGTPDVRPVCCSHPLTMSGGHWCPPAVETNLLTTSSRPEIWRC